MPSPISEKPLDRLIDDLVNQVLTRLSGRIREFRMEWRDGGLILKGCAHTYHAKQLIQQCVMEATDLPIQANEIEVR